MEKLKCVEALGFLGEDLALVMRRAGGLGRLVATLRTDEMGCDLTERRLRQLREALYQALGTVETIEREIYGERET